VPVEKEPQQQREQDIGMHHFFNNHRFERDAKEEPQMSGHVKLCSSQAPLGRPHRRFSLVCLGVCGQKHIVAKTRPGWQGQLGRIEIGTSRNFAGVAGRGRSYRHGYSQIVYAESPTYPCTAQTGPQALKLSPISWRKTSCLRSPEDMCADESSVPGECFVLQLVIGTLWRATS
jgi:hypothetical protein